MTHTVVITGATGAIGSAIVEALLAKGRYRVIAVCRDETKARKLVDRNCKLPGSSSIEYRIADLAEKKQVARLADNCAVPVDVLVNNAAASPRSKQFTAEKIERQLATNVLGYFWMMQFFKTQLQGAAPSRIVNVASYWAGGLDLSDLEFARRPYDNDAAYRQSKQANRMLTLAFADRYRELGIAVNACHPGDVRSKLSSDLGFGGSESAAGAAATPLFLATQGAGIESTGNYYEHRKKVTCPFVADRDAVDRLYQICRDY